MTEKEFNETNWRRGNVVKLQNGKEYLVKGTKGHGRLLLLYSQEYDACFVADYVIVACRTSDYEEPEEVYLEHKRLKQEAIQARIEAERQERLRIKAELKERHLQEQLEAHLAAVRRKQEKREKAMQAQAEKQAAAKAKREAAKALKDAPDGTAKVAGEKKKVAKPGAKVEAKVVKPEAKVMKPEVNAAKVEPKTVKVEPVVASKLEAKPVAQAEVAKAEEPAAEAAPRKRVRQRIKVSASTHEKVEFFKKKK